MNQEDFKRGVIFSIPDSEDAEALGIDGWIGMIAKVTRVWSDNVEVIVIKDSRWAEAGKEVHFHLRSVLAKACRFHIPTEEMKPTNLPSTYQYREALGL